MSNRIEFQIPYYQLSYVTKIFVLTGYYSGRMSFEWGIKILTIDREFKTKSKRDCCVYVTLQLAFGN